MSTETKNNTEQKITERFPLQGTPFMAVRWEDEWMICLGDYILLRHLTSAADAENALETEMWYIIGAMAAAIMSNEEMKNIAKQQNQ